MPEEPTSVCSGTCNLDVQVVLPFNSMPTVKRYCIIMQMTVIIMNEVVKTMCCALRFISPVVNQLQDTVVLELTTFEKWLVNADMYS